MHFSDLALYLACFLPSCWLYCLYTCWWCFLKRLCSAHQSDTNQDYMSCS